MDLIAFAFGIEVGDRRPEPRDLQHHLRAVIAQERLVVSRLEVAPYVVEDRRVDVPLVPAEVRLPAARERVEVDTLGFLDSLAPALPREHRAAQPGRPGCRPGLAYPPVAVHQQPAGDFGQPDIEERERIALVPEDVPAIGLAVEPAGGQPGVEVSGVTGADLEDMRDV